jgi:hypothetical protein
MAKARLLLRGEDYLIVSAWDDGHISIQPHYDELARQPLVMSGKKAVTLANWILLNANEDSEYDPAEEKARERENTKRLRKVAQRNAAQYEHMPAKEAVFKAVQDEWLPTRDIAEISMVSKIDCNRLLKELHAEDLIERGEQKMAREFKGRTHRAVWRLPSE